MKLVRRRRERLHQWPCGFDPWRYRRAYLAWRGHRDGPKRDHGWG